MEMNLGERDVQDHNVLNLGQNVLPIGSNHQTIPPSVQECTRDHNFSSTGPKWMDKFVPSSLVHGTNATEPYSSFPGF